jgi:hypothetical protein
MSSTEAAVQQAASAGGTEEPEGKGDAEPNVGRTLSDLLNRTAGYMTSNRGVAPRALVLNYEHNASLHDEIILLILVTEPVPRVAGDERIEVEELGEGFVRVAARFGFMETPNVASLLEQSQIPVHAPEDVTVFVGRETVVAVGLKRVGTSRRPAPVAAAKRARWSSSRPRRPRANLPRPTETAHARAPRLLDGVPTAKAPAQQILRGRHE